MPMPPIPTKCIRCILANIDHENRATDFHGSPRTEKSLIQERTAKKEMNSYLCVQICGCFFYPSQPGRHFSDVTGGVGMRQLACRFAHAPQPCGIAQQRS